ncbi:response regulator [Brevibacillus centrosporus]|uniref:Transcriptional regulatory protein n=1 Tax=Brevibacillus centrosporus TaxID=54910 RepID=A0A1I3LRK3_9BACL|nr:response regulator [Brevibacillus centrosporus]MEC2131328.1 response regulator [Brevibacillus centrosporus]MED4906853.1 response regulator [Brevibacillus centrosporus]RNB72638.1 response regulator [Brevibacillus centrosporus]SFI87342.1 two-component system, CitB family, response regulator [Brevibacillus centrosporus]GED31539.1 response regulator [Brevibacillus centrosporus]
MSDQPITVMIVEDDEVAAKIYEQFTLKLEGFQIIATASTGKQALDMLHVVTPDMLLLDIFLPDMNGIDLLREVRKHFRGIDVIMITAANDVETVREAIRGGAYSYIIKPIMIDKFMSTLAQYASTRSQLQQHTTMDQMAVDKLFTKASITPAARTAENVTTLPKGIDKLTLKLIRDKMQVTAHSVNADDLAALAGMSHSTVRRYLEFLVSINEVTVETFYGTVGRPERKYRWAGA